MPIAGMQAATMLPGSASRGDVITHIDPDHTEVLGDTVELIAAEKAEVIRPGAG